MKIEKIPQGYLLVREGGNGCELWREYNGAESIACDAIDELIAERDDLRTAVRHESDCVEAAKAEIKALRAKITAMEQQEPVAKVRVHQTGGNAGVAWSAQPLNDFDSLPLLRDSDKLYTLPGAQVQPAPSVPEGWLRAIDEALVVAHLGVANADDSYEEAKRKLNELICWHTDVATDPAVNGGFKLVPADEQSAPSVLDDGFKRAVMEISDIGYGAIFKRMLCERAAELAETAPEAKP